MEVSLGSTGRRAGLRVILSEVGAEQRELEIPVHADRGAMATSRVEIDTRWAGRQVRLVLLDDSDRAALLVDDLWLIAPP